MGRISTKIDLSKFKNAVIVKMGKNKDVDCICIPIAQNNLFKSEKGAVYADFIGFPSQGREGSKDTHLVKQSFSKDLQEKMTEEEKKAQPIFGNHIDWDASSGSSVQSEQGAKVVDDDSQLPF